jgi:hypothetical protein
MPLIRPPEPPPRRPAQGDAFAHLELARYATRAGGANSTEERCKLDWSAASAPVRQGSQDSLISNTAD